MKIWNFLPNNIKEAISHTELKFHIKSRYEPKCPCNLCQTAEKQCGLWMKMSQLSFVHKIYIIIHICILNFCIYMCICGYGCPLYCQQSKQDNRFL